MNGFPWAAFAHGLGFAAAVALAVMLVTFAVALRAGVHRVVDVAWGIGFTAVALVSYALSAGHGDDGRRLLVTVLTAVWGLRLAVYIALRGRGHGEDPRYEAMLARAGGNRPEARGPGDPGPTRRASAQCRPRARSNRARPSAGSTSGSG